MPTKDNKNNLIKPQSSALGTRLVYKISEAPWGLEAFYEGYRLVFSGGFTARRLRAEKWRTILNFFGPQVPKNYGGIIGNVDLYGLFSESAKRAWNESYRAAKKSGHPVGVEHIFLALLKEPSVKNLLARIKASATQAEKFVNNYLRLTPSADNQTVKKIPFEAFALAAKLHNHKIGSLMLLGGLLKATPHDNILQAIFTNIGLSAAKLELFAVWHLDLDYEFPPGTTSNKLMFCLNQTAGLERHFGYFYELPAIERAVELSDGKTLVDLQHLKALQLLVKAGLLAKQKGTKIVSESFVKQAITASS